MRIVVDAWVFFETAGDNEIQPDVAVAQMEELLYHVQQLTAGERETLVEYANRDAKEASDERVRALRQFIESLREE